MFEKSRLDLLQRLLKLLFGGEKILDGGWFRELVTAGAGSLAAVVEVHVTSPRRYQVGEEECVG